ncbi:GIY-YIG nuclease family protein [Chryseobacterium suipulveris]|uniref:GIY-YIG nuclease family protein n=1 Tax=Chryseobacterium suipulveris TaxID=2929800 RepID=A0ABY4BMA2_9FLAO|nr:GIY-YIG nuclease family protein [Chryseobacterium suipulveris]UOE40326.1 GIY-YIG nuclease family protein [Chryseobacterium suipulveris]
MKLSLDDIFNSDEFGLLDIKPKASAVKTEEDRLLDSFQEINSFFEKNNREPSTNSMSEYGLKSRLKSIRTNEKHKITLKPFDKHNLLGEVKMPEISVVDILNDDEFGLLDTDADLSIHTFKHTPKQEERAKTDFLAQRKPMSEKEFAKYEKMFQQVHRELREGKRKLLPGNAEEENLKEGNFYLIDGILAYLEVSDAERVLKENKSGDRVRLEGRTVTIFENATISNMLIRSLGKAVLKNGKLITEPTEKTEEDLFKNAGLVSEEDVKSGWIYILKSKSKNPKISQIKDLYKIGFSTTNVEDRIKNASKEATYLFDDVEIVDKYICYNLNTQNFENLIHRFFGNCCLNIDIYNDKKQRLTPREWFVVPLSIINEVINLIISGGIVNYSYDVEQKKLVYK